MSSTTWVLIAIVTLIVIVGLIAILRGFDPYKPATQDPSVYTDQYKIDSPWGYPKFNTDGTIIRDANGDIVWDENRASSPVTGTAGLCLPYTWKAEGQFTPGFPTISSIESCVTGGPECDAAPNWYAAPCVDDDQLDVQKLQHYCRGDFSQVIRTTGQCLGADGLLHPKGDIEEFWTSCQSDLNESTDRCQGSLSLIAFNSDISQLGPAIFAGASCMSVPSYTVTVSGTSATITNEVINTNTCDMTKIDTSGLPSELIRVVRGIYDGKNFVFSSSGYMVKLVHRPSGMFIGPTLTNNALASPVIGSGLKLYIGAAGNGLVNPRYYTVEAGKPDPQGFWWYLVPPTSDPAYRAPSGTTEDTRSAVQRFLGVGSGIPPPDVRLGSLQYLAFVPDITALPANITTDPKILWTYISTPASAPPVIRASGGALTLEAFMLVNLNSDRNNLAFEQALESSAQYYDYTILPLILTAPVGYYFR